VIATTVKNWQECDHGILRIFAARTTAEIERQSAEQALLDANAVLASRGELEGLITTISTRFVTLEGGDVDAAIVTSLGEIAVFARSERARVFHTADDGARAIVTHEWTACGVESTCRRVVAVSREEVPAIFDHVIRNQVLLVRHRNTLTAEFHPLRELMERQGVLSAIIVPMVYGNRPIGALALHSLHDEQDWSEQDIRLLRLLGEIIASAMARREAEIALERARDVAERANRAKSAFLASMSHELRTPLNGILGYAQLLRHDGSLRPPHAESVAAIERCGEHLLGLIGDVLDLAKIESGMLELDLAAFDLGDLLHDVSDIARVRAGQGDLEFSFEIASRVPGLVVGDQRKLRQVLLNLLGNAVKFTDRGSVRLRVSAQNSSGAYCRLRLEVEDTGVGIAPDELERIFDPFQQVKQTGHHVEGTGLGLAICRRLVQLMGGTLDVRSEPGRGSQFAVEIELQVAAVSTIPTPASAPASAMRVSGYAGRRRRILVADDKADNRQILVSFLRSLGFQVDEAINGGAALEIARLNRPDLVFMDLVMPVMDGFEAIRQLRLEQSLAGIRIVALSASAFDATRTQSITAGCDDFMSKPVRLEEVIELLGRQLGLHWLPETPEAATIPTVPARPAASLDGLPRDVVHELHELAMMGDIRQFLARLREVRARDAQFAHAIDELEELGRSYDMRRLRERLRPLTEGGS
jgi:signal transduction histidine kinase/ActR/RegA family two-component response regulator